MFEFIQSPYLKIISCFMLIATLTGCSLVDQAAGEIAGQVVHPGR